jgi:hypothetical protein
VRHLGPLAPSTLVLYIEAGGGGGARSIFGNLFHIGRMGCHLVRVHSVQRGLVKKLEHLWLTSEE